MVLEYDVNEKTSLKYEYEEKSQEVKEELEKNEKGQIIADYVRLRFEAVKE